MDLSSGTGGGVYESVYTVAGIGTVSIAPARVFMNCEETPSGGVTAKPGAGLPLTDPQAIENFAGQTSPSGCYLYVL